MLNKDNQRELCYVVRINDVRPISGRDRVECAVVNGWTVMVRKDQFKAGDLGIYFEIDSKVPNTAPFEFLAGKHFKIKTQGYKNIEGEGKFYSQGLLMGAEDFGGFQYQDGDGTFYLHFGKDSYFNENVDYREGDFLTKELGVIYAVDDDNKRKADKNPDAKINAALARHPAIAKKYGRIIKKNKFLRWAFVFFFGRKTHTGWIAGVPKTDEERIENRPWTLEDGTQIWVATEKVDGTSTTFYLKRGDLFHKPEFLVCSRNVVFDSPTKGKNNYYADTIGNVYVKMAEKYDMRNILEKLLDKRPSAEWVAVQAETYGEGVQKKDYKLKGQQIAAFNLRYSDCGRVGTLEMRDTLEPLGVPCVPVISEGMTLPSTIEELREFVHSAPSAIDGGMKEGIVFRTLDGGDSFKCVDPEFLLRYHQ